MRLTKRSIPEIENKITEGTLTYISQYVIILTSKKKNYSKNFFF